MMVSNNFRIAVIITTYNRPDALQSVLEAYLAQSDTNFEVWIADDGSTTDTADLVRYFQSRARFPIHHVWQEDIGFRAATIRNRALARTQADYVIYTDGDCIPTSDFVSQHRKLAEPGWFLSGNRILLSESFTKMVLGAHIPLHTWSILKWVRGRVSGKINRVLPLFKLPDIAWLRKRAAQRWQGAKTCNLSAFRRDLLRVNGLDESYTGWGQEDSDLVVRLIRSGLGNKSARFAAPVLHLWHKENDRSHLEENKRRLQEVISTTHTRALKGVDQYL